MPKKITPKLYKFVVSLDYRSAFSMEVEAPSEKKALDLAINMRKDRFDDALYLHSSVTQKLT